MPKYSVRLAAPNAATLTATFPRREQAETFAFQKFDAALAALTWAAKKGVDVHNVPVVEILEDGMPVEDLYLD